MSIMKSYNLMPVVALLIWWCAILVAVRAEEGPELLVKREQRKTLFSSEDGQISAARVADPVNNGSYLLHFFTLEPNSLFLPALLHAHMLFYVHTGSGKLSWTDEGELKSTEIRRGDVFRLEQGSFFFIHSNLETERQKLRIHAIFVDSNNDSHEPATGPYSSIRDMVLGFDRQVLKAAFKVPEEVIDDLANGTSPSAIVHGLPTKTKKAKAAAFEMETLFVRNFLGTRSYNVLEKNKKKKKSGAKLFNLFKADKDFENCNGWSTTVTGKKLSSLKGSNVGLFMVNLTAGSMMGPHWNPAATEIAVVLQGQGVVRVVCSTSSPQCRNTRFQVGEGDVFVVPRFQPMAQMSFNNGTLVFMGFSTSATENHPQYLAGQASVLRTLDRDVLAMSFNVTNTTLDRLLAPQHESVILGCMSCADEELRSMEEEKERTRKEAMEKEEEETRRREEEKKREEEEEAAAKREEEEQTRKEEAEEEARKREEEVAKREEEERRRKEEEEEAEARRKEEEEEARKREEEAAKREEEERMRKEEEEEAEARRKEEEEAARKREEGAAKREEEERMRKEAEEEAEARREKEEEEREREKEKRREEEEEARQREEEAARKEEEERRRKEAEEEAEATRKEEEAAARQREEEEARKGEEERARREEEEQEEETQRRQQEQERRKQKQEEARKREEQKAKQREEDTRQEEQEQEEQEATRRHQEQEEARHREEQHGEGRKSEGERAAQKERRREQEAQSEEEEGGGGQDAENQSWGGKILKKRLSV